MLNLHHFTKISGPTKPVISYDMNTISYYLGISKQTEVLLLVLAGICCTIFDASLFNLHTNLYKVWNMPMDPTKFTDTAQLYVKYILSSIVLVRTFTVHLYLAFYIVMLWPAIFEEKPGLLIPWLTVGAVKCLATGAMSFSTGMYICLTYRFSKAACWDFMLTQMIDQGPSIYMWFCVLSYYYDLKRSALNILCDGQTTSPVSGLAERRRRVRSLIPGTKLHHTFDDERQLISASTIDTLVNQLNTNLRNQTSRSLDSLLCKIAAEAEKEEIFGTKEETLEDEKGLSIADKTLRTLNISPSYVTDAKSRKKPCSAKCMEGKSLKVKSTPLPVTKSPEDRSKLKTLNVKVTPVKSDEISIILSEKELLAMDIDEDTQLRHLNTPPSSFGGNELSTEIQKLFESKSDMENEEFKEIRIKNFDDNISDYSKTVCFETDNSDNHLGEDISKEKDIIEDVASQSIEGSAVKALAQKTSCKANCMKRENDLAKSIAKENENVKRDQSIERTVIESLPQKSSCKANSMKIDYLAKNISKQNENVKTCQSIERPVVECLAKKPFCKANSVKIDNLDYLAKNIAKQNENVKTCQSIERPVVECLTKKPFCKANSMEIDNLDYLAKNTAKQNQNVKTCQSIERPVVECLAKKPFYKANSMKTDNLAKNVSKKNENGNNTGKAKAYVKRPVPNVMECLTQKQSECPPIDVTKEKISNHCLSNDIHKEIKVAEGTYLGENGIENPVVDMTQKENFPKPAFEIINTNNEDIVECRCDTDDKMLPKSKTSLHVTEPPPTTLKSKSQDTNKSHLIPSTFKYDGYTLAYIESERRKAAIEIITNRNRPGSSGS